MCFTIAHASRSAPGRAATAACPSGARPTSPRAGPTAATAAAAATSLLRCDDNLRDLQSFRRRAHFRAERGGHGQGTQRHGADGETLVIAVPPGTQVERWDGTRYDLVRPGQEVTVARGGAGGRGNTRFKSSVRQSPRLAERGLPGDEGAVELHLKLLADVGLVGLPNAGKSSLLSRMTRAQPKVAAYPFTTLEPVLGTLEADDRQLVLADIPGLIEGASDGAGLGHDFLAHVERTRLLVHVLDLAPLDGSEPAANHAVIERELAEHDPRLAALPRVLALSKADLVTPEAAADAQAAWRAVVGEAVPVLITSSATRQGLDELARELLRRVPPAQPVELEAAGEDEVAEFKVFRPAARRSFDIERVGDREFRVTGEAVDRLIARHDMENDEALALVEHRLRRMGVIAALEAHGFQPGDDVELGGVVFELDPELALGRGLHAADAVGGVQRGDLVGLRERRVVEHRGDEEVQAARALGHHRLADVDQLRRGGADHVHAEQAAVLRVHQQLQHPGPRRRSSGRGRARSSARCR